MTGVQTCALPIYSIHFDSFLLAKATDGSGNVLEELSLYPVFRRIYDNLNNVKKKAEKQVEQRIEKKADKAVDKTLDKVEEGIDNTVKNTGKKKETETENKDSQTPAEQTDETTTVEKTAPVLTWAKYDFVPGTEIIFEDNLEGEQNGEFPSKWDLKAGTVEIANLNGDNVIWFRNSDSKIIPLIKVANYLPDEFTIEFDYQMYNATQHHYQLYFSGEAGKRALS